MDELKQKVYDLFGEDFSALTEEDAQKRIHERSEGISTKKLETLSKVLDAENQKRKQLAETYLERNDVSNFLISLPGAAVVGIAVYHMVPSFEPLRDLMEAGIRSLIGMQGNYGVKAPADLPEKADYIVKSMQGVAAFFGI